MQRGEEHTGLGGETCGKEAIWKKLGRSKDNIRMDLTESAGKVWTEEMLRVVMNTVMKLPVA